MGLRKTTLMGFGSLQTTSLAIGTALYTRNIPAGMLTTVTTGDDDIVNTDAERRCFKLTKRRKAAGKV